MTLRHWGTTAACTAQEKGTGPALRAGLLAGAEPPLTATLQSCRHLLRHPDAAWAEVPMLPKAAQAVLEQRFVRATSSLEACQRSADGTTTKLLVRLQDGLQVEAVVMTYSHPGACFAAPSL